MTTSTDFLREKGYPVDSIVIRMPDRGHNHFGLEMNTDNETLIVRFKQLVWDEMTCNRLSDPDYEEKHSWGTFWQGSNSRNSLTDPSDWEYFELWHEPTLAFQDRLFAKAQDIAERLGCPVEIV